MVLDNLKKYLILLGITMAALIALDIGINAAVDPLFFFGGNKISGKGYFLNERISVLAYNRHRWPKIDCLIFGSSRMTYLDARKIEGHTCANMAFSGGQLSEFILYAEYLKGLGVQPRLIIVGADNFGREPAADNVPQFVKQHDPLPAWLSYYTSVDSLLFSLEALVGVTASPHYYTSDYRKHFGSPPRMPGMEHAKDSFVFAPGDAKEIPNKIKSYRRLCKIFPQAECVGIVPPDSTWGIENGLVQGLGPYLEAMQNLAHVFTSFYDFSIPADPTWDFTETVDGIHFSAEVHDQIAAKISRNDTDQRGFDVKAMPLALYEKRYLEAAAKAVADRKKRNGF